MIARVVLALIIFGRKGGQNIVLVNGKTWLLQSVVEITDIQSTPKKHQPLSKTVSAIENLNTLHFRCGHTELD